MSTYKQILEPMKIVREYCRLGHKLRQKYNIPVSYPLYEIRINVLDLPYHTDDGLSLLKAERQLIADELNIEWVEPIMTAPWSKYATVAKLQEKEYYIEIDITKDHYLDRLFEERVNHRKEMQRRKDNDYEKR
jgi:hypothetical protein